MDEPLTLRPEVAAFAQLMEAKLREHDDDRDGWKDEDPEWLLERMEEELEELRAPLKARTLVPHLGEAVAILDRESAGEAVDVANFAMMIAAVLGALVEGHAEEKESGDEKAIDEVLVAAEAWATEYGPWRSGNPDHVGGGEPETALYNALVRWARLGRRGVSEATRKRLFTLWADDGDGDDA